MRWNSKNPITKGPFTDWNPKSFGNFRGDGQWICCGGPDLLPLATLRLENFRDGLEDLWYARLLERKLKELMRNAQCRMHNEDDAAAQPSNRQTVKPSNSASWAQRAREALAVPRELVRSPGDFSTNPDILYRWRDEMADLIEEAQTQR